MSKISEIKKYKKLLSYMFSEPDIARYFDIKGKILKFSELSKYNNIQELLPNDKDFKFILTETEPNTGHWCVLLNSKGKIIWYDSYAIIGDGELKFIPRLMNKLLHQTTHPIHRLFKQAKKDGFQTEYNTFKYQSESDDVCTCGRWCVLAVLLMNLNYSLKEMQEFVERWSYEKSMPFDILVVNWII